MFPLEAIVPRACTSMARGLELEIWEQNYCLAIVYQLPVKLRTLCQWPMKCRAQTEFPRGLRFPVPLDKGNGGSGDEIVKDHKENFQNNPKSRLINPAKNNLGLVSKQILDRIDNNIRSKMKLNQWKKHKIGRRLVFEHWRKAQAFIPGF